MEYLFTTFSSFLSYLGENRDMDRSGLDASISCRSASTLRRPSAFWENKNNLSPKKFHLFFPQMKSYLHFLPCMKRKSKYSREPLVCLAQFAQTNQKDSTQHKYESRHYHVQLIPKAKVAKTRSSIYISIEDSESCSSLRRSHK